MMLKRFLNRQNNLQEKLAMLQSILGIGDILVYELERNNEERVLTSLMQLFELLESLFAIRKSDPEKFDKLILSKEYHDLHAKNEKNAQLNISMYSEKYTDGFTTIINQILRVYKKSVEVSNLEVSRYAIYVLKRILGYLSNEPDNDLFVDQILRTLSNITYQATEEDNYSIFNSAISLYRDIVFNYDNKFKISYLQLFDRYFFSSVKTVISKNKYELFKILVSYIIDGIHPDLNSKDIWDYGHLLLDQDLKLYSSLNEEYGIENKLNVLSDSIKYINSKKDMEDWKSEFNNLKTIIRENIKNDLAVKADELENMIVMKAEQQYKFNNLIGLFISIGAFCLFEKKIYFIKYLWNYNQPEDADSTWISLDLLPENLDSLMTIYFDLVGSGVNFFVGHHGSTKYVKNYFLLLMCKLLQSVRNTPNARQSVNGYHLPDLDIYKLSNLIHRCEDLVGYANNLAKESNIFLELDFEDPVNLFSDKVIPFLEHVKIEAQNQISAKHRDFPISEIKVENFKNNLILKFYEFATLREILTKQFNAYVHFEEKPTIRDNSRFGLSVIEDKAVFFDTWHIHYSNWQDGFPRSLANGEDNELFKKILDECQSIISDDIESVLKNCESLNSVVILSSNVGIWKYFKGKEEFKASWRNDVEKLDISSFKGWFEFHGYSIPVFSISNTGYENTILILSTSKFGKLCQYSPMINEDDDALRRDIFYMNIKLLTHREDLLEKFRLEPPQWLSDQGDIEAQQAYIQTRVVIEIYEMFDFIPNDDFLGYRWDIP
ncbi:MAG: hypothetical protein CK424_03330 [Legionella sp.]|nr:MAG: hypothetical protein CK424_03330 [Legionella sp.]